jgi:hypothetical protein
MQIIDTRVEPDGPGRIKVTTRIALNDDPRSEGGDALDLGEGPTGDAVPDKIVKELIREAPGHTLSADQLKRRLGGHPGTVNRQAWTLANNAPDLQRRLRGWVVSPDRGLYALSPAALEVIKKGGRSK